MWTGHRPAAAHYPDVTLRIEPGRALTAYAGWYAAEVLDVRSSYGEWFAVLSGGTHHLRTPAARGHDQPFDVVPTEDWGRPRPRPALTGLMHPPPSFHFLRGETSSDSP